VMEGRGMKETSGSSRRMYIRSTADMNKLGDIAVDGTQVQGVS
jgi:hypothetical protein